MELDIRCHSLNDIFNCEGVAAVTMHLSLSELCISVNIHIILCG